MFVEIWQFQDILEGNFHYLIFHFIVFVLLASVSKKIFSLRYDSSNYFERRDKHTISVIVAAYHEDSVIYENCLKSIRENNPDELIVILDEGNNSSKQITEKYSDKYIYREGRQGKRTAVAWGVKQAKGDIVAVMDSDGVMQEGCINEFVKPFSDKKVVGVATAHSSFATGTGVSGYLSWKLSQLIERTRIVTNKALNENLVVADGTCYVYKKSFLEGHLKGYLNEKFSVRRCCDKEVTCAEDRYFTYHAHMNNLKIVFQSGAVVDAAAPPTLKGYFKQQLRWLRGGIYSYIREVRTNIFRKTGLLYAYHVTTYYLASISFMVALIVDLTFFQMRTSILPLYVVPFLILSGCTIITMLRQVIMLGRKANLYDSFWFGIIGLFCMFPINIYAWLTFYKVSVWEKGGKEVVEVEK